MRIGVIVVTPEPSNATPIGAIEKAMAHLAELDSVPTDQHPAVFEEVHAALTDALASVTGT